MIRTAIPTTGAPTGAPAWPARLALAAATYAIAGGLVTLLGWVADVPRLTAWKNDGISMFPNTAICAVLSGIALVLGQRAGTWTRAAIRLLATIVASIGALTLVEHLAGVTLGIDTALFYREWGQTAAAAPMRMGPPASLAFFAIGAALGLLTDGGRGRAVGSGLGVGVMALSMLSLTGHLYGATEMFTIPRLTGIAMQTASIIFALGLGVVANAPDREPMRTIAEPSAAGLIARRTLPAIVAVALGLGWLRVYVQQQGLVDLPFGTALRTLVEVMLLVALLWWAVSKVRTHERDRLRAETQLQRQANQLSTFLETAAVGMHWIGHDGTVLWANDAELTMLGYSPAEYVGHRLGEFHADDDTARDILARLHRDERLLAHPVRMRCKDGAFKDVLLDATVLWEGDRFVHAQCFTRDATEQLKADRVRALIAAIVEASDDAIVSKTLDGVVSSWNRGAERIFGYTAAEMIGAPIETIIPADRRQEEQDILRRLRLGERIEHFDTVRQTKDGRLVDVALTISPVKDAYGSTVGASKIARDITDRKRREAEREDDARRKDEFIAMLAHELRNPLAPIHNATRLLALLTPNEPRTVHALEIIERQAGHLARLVDDLLDVSRITRGKVTLQRETLTVEAIVSAGVEIARPLIDQLGHTLTVSHMHRPLRLEGDFARLVQVVSNLLTNAAKFTPSHGHITVTTQETDGRATIRVRDTGVGVPADLQPKIFDLFVQADGGLARTRGGLGIGLTLVHRIVALHGGTVEVRSEGAGRGSEFVVTIPALPASDLVTSHASPRLAAGNKPLRVLLVEDNPDAAESLRMLLELGGHDIRVARDGFRALELVEGFSPDIAFVDVGLPGIDGYELAARLRAHAACRSTVLVALTGYGRDDDKRRATEAGFDHHLTKPADYEAIDRLLANVSSAAGSVQDDRGQLQ